MSSKVAWFEWAIPCAMVFGGMGSKATMYSDMGLPPADGFIYTVVPGARSLPNLGPRSSSGLGAGVALELIAAGLCLTVCFLNRRKQRTSLINHAMHNLATRYQIGFTKQSSALRCR